jgi:hypothetical protein
MDETTDTKKTKILKRDPGFRSEAIELVITGPNFYVANPFAKTPRDNCSSKGDFDVIDLAIIPKGYMPRSVYKPNVDLEEFKKALNSVSWDRSKKHVSFSRLAVRRMTNSAHERTLKSALISPNTSHVNTIYSISFEHDIQLLNVATLISSLPYDYIAKVSGIADFWFSQLKALPWVTLPDTALHRYLQLNCLTDAYADLWDRIEMRLNPDPWSSDDPRLVSEGPHTRANTWTPACAIRSDYARRQALLEIDVLVAIALHLKLGQLKELYRVQFGVLRACDQNTWYDQKGRIVFTNSKNLSGVGLDLKTWKSQKDITKGAVSKTFIDDTMPGGPIERTITYHAPFTLPNREEDYGRAWSFFYPKFASMAAAA